MLSSGFWWIHNCKKRNNNITEVTKDKLFKLSIQGNKGPVSSSHYAGLNHKNKQEERVYTPLRNYEQQAQLAMQVRNWVSPFQLNANGGETINQIQLRFCEYEEYDRQIEGPKLKKELLSFSSQEATAENMLIKICKRWRHTRESHWGILPIFKSGKWPHLLRQGGFGWWHRIHW